MLTQAVPAGGTFAASEAISRN